MMIKKFTAPTLKEAVTKMRLELGEDAVVMKTSKVKGGGLLEFAGKEAFEITGAIDKGVSNSYAGNSSDEDGDTAQAGVGYSRPRPNRSNDQNQKGSRSKQKDETRSNGEGRSKSLETSNLNELMIKSEISDLKSSIDQVSSFLKYQSVPALPKNLQIIIKQLLDNEVDDKIAKDIVESIHNELAGHEYDDLKMIVSLLLKKIALRMNTIEETPHKGKGPKVVMLIGPTGVGKTTTIAKLAANQKLVNKKKVALISADTFRIGAIDQLKTFANIAEIPLTVAYTPKDMANAIKDYSKMDVIYIDTTGRSQRDKDRLNEMKKFVTAAGPDETQLVLSVTTRQRDLQEAMGKFSIFNYNRLIFTKTDETTSLGIILNLLNHCDTPVSYITNGQNVPEDIEKATLKKLAKMVVRRKGD